MYDILYVSQDNILEDDWLNFKSKFPRAIRCDNVKTFDDLRSKSFTKFFWIVWDDLEIADDFKFDYVIPAWDNQYTHVFLNGTEYNGIVLISKDAEVSSKEIEFRFFMNHKPVEIAASKFKKTSKFNKYDILYASRDNILEDDWLNFKSKFSRAIRCDNVKTFSDLTSKSFTKFFWIVWDDLEIAEDFKFDYVIPAWDNQYPHAFLNGTEYNGIILISKNAEVSNKEIEFRFFMNHKPIEITASKFKKYDIILIGNVDQTIKKKFPQAKNLSADATLEEIKNTASTKMFWCIWDDILVNDDFDFSYRAETYMDTKQIHAFKNGDYYDGICLLPKDIEISQREFSYRFFANKKETNIQASMPKPYDIIFISYHENNANENYKLLQQRFPRVKRIDGIKGIHLAHIEAAKLSSTDMFWVVDADAVIIDNFNFDHVVSTYDKETVHVWRSQNPINDLEYGYGGVKLLPRKLTLNMDITKPDMTTSISKQFKAMNAISNITTFNTDPFSAWKSAFRECVKLSSGTIARNKESETIERLSIWCSVGEEKPFGNYALAGARSGKLYGETHRDDTKLISMINDFEWLEQQFKKEFPL